MAYSLRGRKIADLVIEDDEVDECFDACSEEDAVLVEYKHSDYENESESESSDDEEMAMDFENATAEERTLTFRARGRPKKNLRGKNGFVWSINIPRCQSDPQSIEPVLVPGPSGPAANLETITEFWEALFSADIIEIIVHHTNIQIENYCLSLIEQDNDLQTYHHHTDEDEIRAYIGILYFSGSWKSSNVNCHDLWDSRSGINFYPCVMSKARFMVLSSCLRFDDKAARNRDDVFSPIRQIWEIFNSNCASCYQAGRDCTVDEILLGFRGRCKFRMYIKSKPDKYGLKFFALNDSSTSYLINSLPYLGKIRLPDKLDNEQLSEYYFRKVTDPIHGTKRAVTCDNWFTSVPLLQRMKEEPYGLKITGTIRKNKRELAVEMKVSSKTPPSSAFFHADDMTLVSYTQKKNKIVLVISNDICSTEIQDAKPAIVLHYNATKGGTDCFDWLCRAHTVSRKSNRWPMRVFLGMLDQAAVNARILLKCRSVNAGNKVRISTKHCLDKISFHLVKPLLEKRYVCTTLRSYLRTNIGMILGKNAGQEPDMNNEKVPLPSQKRCQLCKRGKDKKTKQQCPSCLRAMCNEHRAYACIDCHADND